MEILLVIIHNRIEKETVRIEEKGRVDGKVTFL